MAQQGECNAFLVLVVTFPCRCLPIITYTLSHLLFFSNSIRQNQSLVLDQRRKRIHRFARPSRSHARSIRLYVGLACQPDMLHLLWVYRFPMVASGWQVIGTREGCVDHALVSYW